MATAPPVLVLLLTALVPVILSQSCQPLTSVACSPFVDVGTQIFLPPGVTLEIAEHVTSSQVNLINLNPVEEPCRSTSIRLTCASWLRPCAKDFNGTYIPVPEEPCENLCTDYETACSPFVVTSGVPLGSGIYYPPGYSLPLNCSTNIIDSYAGNISFYQPSSNYSTEYQGTTLWLTCSPSTPLVIPVPVSCQSPLIVSPSTGFCAFSCPLPSLTDQQYTNVKVMQGVLGWISWVATAILVIAMTFYPRTRDFPRNLIIMTAAAANTAAGGIILPTYAGYESTWCGGGESVSLNGSVVGFDAYNVPVIDFVLDASTLSFASPLCTLQGAIIQFGFLSAVFWWVIIAFNMCIELYLGQRFNLNDPKWKWIRFGVYQLYGWGVPFILMVIPASAGQIKFAPEGTYCFVTGEDNNAWSLTFWFLPVGISLLMGICLFFAALGKITHLFVTLRKFKKLLMLHLRLFLFICLYLILFIFIFAYTIQFTANENAINDMYSTYYTCLIEAGGDTCGLDSSLTYYNLIMLKGFAISSLGLLLFILFISWDVSRFWFFLARSLVYTIIRRSPKEAVSLYKMVMYKSSTMTTMHTSDTLQVSYEANAAGAAEENEEEEDEEKKSASSQQETPEQEAQNSSSSDEQD